MKKTILNLSLICGLISAIMLSMVGFQNACGEMQENIIRIRIIANSDSAEDQDLKLDIRDAVLEGSRELFGGIDSYDDAVEITENKLDTLLKFAEDEIHDQGYDYGVSLDFRDEFFETRVYDDFTLPAGYYKTAVFTVGEGKGQNWWCVIYPQVCVGACSSRLNDGVSDSSAELAYSGKKYVAKFRAVEIYEKIKKYFNF